MQNDDSLKSLIKYFLQGIVIIGPLAATIWIIWTAVSSIDNIIPGLSREYPGLVFILMILSTTLIGFLGSKFLIGRVIVKEINHFLEHTPGVKFIYTSLKEVMSSFVGDKKKFNTPVWVKVSDSPEVWRIGFLTQKSMNAVHLHGMVSVYLPHSYAISGWVIITQAENTKPVQGMSAAQAMKFAVSGGVAGFEEQKEA